MKIKILLTHCVEQLADTRGMNSNSSSIWPNSAKFLRPCPSLSLPRTPLLHFTGWSSPFWPIAPGSFFSLASKAALAEKQ